MKNEDNRNYNVTIKVAEVLDLVKGFDVARGTPRSGKIIIRYEDVNYILNIVPLYTEDGDNKVRNLPFETIAQQNAHLLD